MLAKLSKSVIFILTAIAVPVSLANAQMGAVRKDNKKVKVVKPSSTNTAQCRSRIGQTIQPDDFQTVFTTLKSQAGGSTDKSKYETQAQYEARMGQMSQGQYIFTKPFKGRYNAEEQRFVLWYRDFVGQTRSMFLSAPLDKFIALSAKETGFSSGITSGSRGRGLGMSSTSNYDATFLDTGSSYKRRSGSQPMFAPEYILPEAPGGSNAKYGTRDPVWTNAGINKLRWYLNMSGSEAQANDGAMKWGFEMRTNGQIVEERMSPASGAQNANFFDSKIISGQLGCAMILDRNNTVKKLVPVRR